MKRLQIKLVNLSQIYDECRLCWVLQVRPECRYAKGKYAECRGTLKIAPSLSK